MERRALVITEHIVSNLEQKIQRMARIESLEEKLLKQDEVKKKTKIFLNKI